MKVLFVGDIHTHDYMIEDIKRLDNKYNFYRIVCLGDYVDDWLSSGYDSINTLNKIVELKNSNKDKYIMLLGNHEMSYLGFPCSGHQFGQEKEIQNILLKNIDLFDLWYSINLGNRHCYCTHAGITNSYIHGVLNRINEEDLYLYKTNSYIKNLDIINKDKLKYLHLLHKVSSLRGGQDEYSSFVWCDKREHEYFSTLEQYIIPYQIIGHTPVQTISTISSPEGMLYFIDTHSTYRDGRNIGDKSYLIWNDNEFIIEH